MVHHYGKVLLPFWVFLKTNASLQTKFCNVYEGFSKRMGYYLVREVRLCFAPNLKAHGSLQEQVCYLFRGF